MKAMDQSKVEECIEEKHSSPKAKLEAYLATSLKFGFGRDVFFFYKLLYFALIHGFHLTLCSLGLNVF